MTTQNSIAVLDNYPSNKFNRLIPVRSIQEIPMTHKVVINEVAIDPDPNGKDVYVQQKKYKDKSGTWHPEKLSLTKKGLSKLMAAANIQIIDSKSITPSGCEKCIEMANRTRLAPRCFECPSKDDVAWQVTIAVPEPSGTVRIVKGSKELRLADEKAKMTEGQFKQMVPYRTEHAESKALNRCLREALMIKDSYQKEELMKPFAVALVVPNLNDKDMKKAYIDKFKNSQGALFGTTPQIEAAATHEDDMKIESTGYQSVGFNDGTIDVEYTDSIEEIPSFDIPFEYINCQGDDCGAVIEGFTDGNGKVWEPEAFAEYTQNVFGRQLCKDCATLEFKRRKESAK